MRYIYNALVFITTILLSLVALFHKKINLFVAGRKQTFEKLTAVKNAQNTIWFHAASLGEFEQGRPVMEAFKEQYPTYKIVLTFFSPSGYEVRKDYGLADVVCYLPVDSEKNVQQFLDLVKPKMAIFIKYEFWPNFLNGLKLREIPTILISGIFRPNQIFFKKHGGFMLKALKTFDHFFVQDQSSKELLNTFNINNASISGDTRFDRVHAILDQKNDLDFIDAFKNKHYTVVAGSTWKEDEKLLVDYINSEASENTKFIIAPHNIVAKDIEALKKSLQKTCVLYSSKSGKNLADYQVLIIDTIGLLTKIYSAADVAYVGGGFGKSGVHNILEPATFGIPIIIGPVYEKYKEVVDLVALKSCLVVSDKETFSSTFTQVRTDETYRSQLGKTNHEFIQNNLGATKMIMEYINTQLK
ncbi:3-deoxy-D-manno-octulosonic acid transferase [Polaribacter pacificus]|uniref:3-deoxy-D-manno-octulosonic acid transferase n=1 Tax=Polaribacter pacificus TaxID=1775173 RepID=UPI001662E633|nr:glycosyltransferase N-terminal domain-containing protein [Polaribacter pacificus]